MYVMWEMGIDLPCDRLAWLNPKYGQSHPPMCLTRPLTAFWGPTCMSFQSLACIVQLVWTWWCYVLNKRPRNGGHPGWTEPLFGLQCNLEDIPLAWLVWHQLEGFLECKPFRIFVLFWKEKRTFGLKKLVKSLARINIAMHKQCGKVL